MTVGLNAALWLADVQQKTPPDDKVTPGLIGFLVTFGLVIAVILLIRSMVTHVRRVQYSPDPTRSPEAPKGPDEPQS
ncbi:hypothetical protein ACIB24_16125 [Spongisporangium articulatum]|uniref:Uncharacterized protein n=1 Tax=Spongisporangium articulatum TaxID=3362603 RepID=A0ABW8AQF1_9ACTN